jgi:hypothetical protein
MNLGGAAGAVPAYTMPSCLWATFCPFAPFTRFLDDKLPSFLYIIFLSTGMHGGLEHFLGTLPALS